MESSSQVGQNSGATAPGTSSSDTGESSKVFRFAKRAIKIVATGFYIAIFPLTAFLAAGVNYHYCRKNESQNRKTRVVNALKAAMYPLPIIGPILNYKYCENVSFGKEMKFSNSEMKKNRKWVYFLTCIPFVSTSIAAIGVADYIFGKN